MDNFFEETDVFGVDNNFAMAFGLINDDLDLSPLTPDIGKIEIIANTWGYDDDDEYFYDEIVLPTHPCSAGELGLGDNKDESLFFPIKPSSVEELEYMLGKMLCIDKKEMFMYGDFNADNARMFEIKISKCTDESDCADEGTILDYFKGIYIDLMTNRIRFDFREFGHNSFIQESILNWTPVQTQI